MRCGISATGVVVNDGKVLMAHHTGLEPSSPKLPAARRQAVQHPYVKGGARR